MSESIPSALTCHAPARSMQSADVPFLATKAHASCATIARSVANMSAFFLMRGTFLFQADYHTGRNDFQLADAADIIRIGGSADKTLLAHTAERKATDLDGTGVVKHET